MKTINATKGELVNIINGLFAVQELKGKTFSLTVSKNISILRDTLKDVEEAGKPSPEFLEVAQKVNEIANENKEDAKEQIDKLEEENKELVEARRSQMDNVEKLMAEESTVDLHVISEEILPENISASQINKLIKIIE